MAEVRKENDELDEKAFRIKLYEWMKTEFSHVQKTEQEVLFWMEGFMGHQEWKAGCETFFLPDSNSKKHEKRLVIRIVVARNVQWEDQPELMEKLMQLQTKIVLGKIGIDVLHQMYYQYLIPVTTTDEEETFLLYQLSLSKMVDFLNQYFAYLLLCVQKNKEISIEEYEKDILGE